ncbi:dihydrolipoyl dehydrogenase [bacterium]|mgnify:CR=1 FL=1|nr:MAG: dihydrolipoyl dehydrogenase [bacterium]
MKIGIIGGGPAGYVAAIRGAQLGAEVVVIEKDNLGGTCTNWGCIPTKALFSITQKIHDFRWGNQKKMWEVELPVNAIDWRMVMNFKNGVVARLVKGIEFLFKKNRIMLVNGEAIVRSPNEIEVETAEGMKKYKFDRILLATGSTSGFPPIDGLEGISPWDNIKALSADKLPQSLLILGGGVIGVEFANIFQSFGTQVTIVELLPKILANQDDEVSSAIHRALVGEGVKIYTSSRAVKAHRSEQGVKLELDNDNVLTAEEIIVATGRKVILPPGGEDIGLSIENNAVAVDEYRRTKLENVYAVGDITGEPHLAHKASHEGIVAVEHIMGMDSRFDPIAIPSAIFSALEVGTIGLTEKQARQKYSRQGDIKVGKFPYIASGRAQAEGETVGFIKTIADPKGNIIGFHAVGKHSSELLALGGYLIQTGATISDVKDIIFAHPTLSEMLGESVLAADNSAIHIV